MSRDEPAEYNSEDDEKLNARIQQWFDSEAVNGAISNQYVHSHPCRLLGMLSTQVENIIGPVLGNSRMIQHPNYPNQFHVTKSAYFLFGIYKGRIEETKRQLLSTDETERGIRKKSKEIITHGRFGISEEAYYIMVQNHVDLHIKDVQDQSGCFIYCLNYLLTAIRKECTKFQNKTSQMKYLQNMSKGINYFVQLLLPEVILPELIQMTNYFDPFEELSALFDLCYSYIVPHVSVGITDTLATVMVEWISQIEVDSLYKLSRNRDLFDFFVHTVPMASTEENTKLLNGILIEGATFVSSRDFSFQANMPQNCIAIRQLQRANKNVEISLESDNTAIQNRLLIDINGFISVLEKSGISIVLLEDVVDEILQVEMAKRNILCLCNVSDLDNICNLFQVLPMTICSLSRYNEEKRKHQLVFFGSFYDDTNSHIFQCKNLREISMTPIRKFLYLEPCQPVEAPSMVIRAPLDSLAETYRDLLFKFLIYLTNSFKFLTEDPNLPVVVTVPACCYFENQFSLLLRTIRQHHRLPVAGLEEFMNLLEQSYESLTIQMMKNLTPNLSNSQQREILLHLQSSKELFVSFSNVPQQDDVFNELNSSHSKSTLSSKLISEGILLTPNNFGLTETLSCKYNTVTNLCLTLKRLLTIEHMLPHN